MYSYLHSRRAHYGDVRSVFGNVSQVSVKILSSVSDIRPLHRWGEVYVKHLLAPVGDGEEGFLVEGGGR